MHPSEDRREMEKRLVSQLAPGLSKEQYDNLVKTLKAMPDYDFWQLMAEMKHRYENDPDAPKSEKEHLEIQKELLRINREAKNSDSALNYIPIEFVSEADNTEMLNEIAKSNPSDYICLTRESDMKLISLWEDGNIPDSTGAAIPSDLFFAGTIPLLDCVIEIDERGAYTDAVGHIVTSRIVIFDDYIKRISDADADTTVCVGALMVEYKAPWGLIAPIQVTKGFDSLVGTGVVNHRNMTAEMKNALSKKCTKGAYMEFFTALMETWYGIQIALLHPTVKEIFETPKAIKLDSIRKLKPSERKNKVKYIKRHVIDPVGFDTLIFGETGETDPEKKINRRALVWYVIGHWRVYQDGRKTFVKPYWKGALRETKKNITDRERVIVQE